MARTKLSKRGVSLHRLTDKERVFIEEYRKSLDGTAAALVAFNCKSRNSAAALACKVLKRPLVKKALGKLLEDDRRRREVEADEILTHLADCATRNAKLLFDENGILVFTHKIINGKKKGKTIHDLPDEITNTVDGVKQKVKRYETEDGTVVVEVETELKLVSKASAIDMAMKHEGLYAPNKNLVGVVGVEWDKLAGVPAEDGEDPVEAVIRREEK